MDRMPKFGLRTAGGSAFKHYFPAICIVGLIMVAAQGLRYLSSELQSFGVESVDGAQEPGGAQALKKRSLKKGVGTEYNKNVEKNLAELDLGWFYTWKINAEEANIKPPEGVEHVSMVWGASDATPENLKKAKGENLLGFNEPDRFNQANMTVQEALDLWPVLEASGKRLGSPACAENPLDHSWLRDFVKGAKERGLRVDFIALHRYIEDHDDWETPKAVQDIKSFIENIHAIYNLPIWLTEFALTDWTLRPENPPLAVYPPFKKQAAFAKAVCEMMNTLPFVERYAFFSMIPYTPNSASHMFNTDGSMTVLGKAYKSVA